MKRTAVLSPDGVYRYELTREEIMGPCEVHGNRALVICGLNPSTADADIDDQTIRKEIGFARLWKCNRLVKVNAYGFRATDPNVVKAQRKAGFDVIGQPENDFYIRRAIRQSLSTYRHVPVIEQGICLLAWGAHIEIDRQRQLAAMFDDVGMCLGTNGGGSPKHTLYIAYETTPQPWKCPS